MTTADFYLIEANGTKNFIGRTWADGYWEGIPEELKKAKTKAHFLMAIGIEAEENTKHWEFVCEKKPKSWIPTSAANHSYVYIEGPNKFYAIT